jgi:CRISPR-associated protein Cas2
MWLQVIFDLPVGTPSQRKRATTFRNQLLDLGFEMVQFSVYLRFCPDKSAAESYIKHLESDLPPNGSIKMLTFTDNQYENIKSYMGQDEKKKQEIATQLSLF